MKQVEITPAIRAKLTASLGDDAAKTSDLAVFESVAGNTLPLRRRTGIYAGARIGHDTLGAMHAHLENGGTTRLQIQHDSEPLPVGRVFMSTLHPSMDGNTRMNTLFYLNKKTDADLVAKLDTGVINDVSLGFDPTALRCSACGWDYKGPEATFDNILDCTCANKHTIGKDGVYVRTEGLADWKEQSLVGLGAVVGSTILSRPQHTRAPGNAMLLAERGFDPATLTCFCAVSETADLVVPPTEKPDMITVEAHATLMAENTVAKRDLELSSAKLTAAEAEKATAVAALAAAQAEIVTLKAGDSVKLAAEIVTLKADRDALVGVIDKRITAHFAVLGQTGGTVPATVAEKITLLDEQQAALASSVPTGGRSVNATGGGGGKEAPSNYAAFKSSK